VTAPDFAFDAVKTATESANPRLAGREGAEVTTVQLEAAEDGTDAAQTLMLKMRGAASGDEAYEQGKGLPEATRLYIAGAVDFDHAHRSHAWGEETSDEEEDDPNGLETALGRFQQILQLPSSEARPRILWATFMSGRCHALRAQPGDLEQALAEFRKVTELVRAGAADPMGLGHAALGEAARVDLKAGHFAAAVRLYAEQASEPYAGSAIVSLRRATNKLLKSGEPIDPWVRDPVVQKALVAYAVSATAAYYQERTCVAARGCDDQDADDSDMITRDAAIRLLEAIAKLDAKQVQWPDQVAALAYKFEKYDVVTRVLALSNTPYADWIRAKMALHAGDLQAAAAAFARASKGFATNDSSTALPAELARRFQGEQGLTSLARSDYVEAFNQLLAGGYEDDARYVAERVLTLEELQRLVDKQSLGKPFRDLLARRLTRAGRYSEALVYYESDSVRQLAEKYSESMQQAQQQGATPGSRAAGWYEVARLEIQSGMELRGTERCPDYTEYEGSYGDECAPQLVAGDLMSQDELARLNASAVTPDRRFHYRQIGVEHLMKAADALPRRSPDFDAVLCQGVHWLQTHGRTANEDLIEEVYRRYVRQGRAEPWAGNFGTECPDPKFGPGS